MSKTKSENSKKFKKKKKKKIRKKNSFIFLPFLSSSHF